MPGWVERFDVKDLWEQAKARDLTVAQLSQKIADRIDGRIWITLKPNHIRDALLKLAQVEDASFDAFDIIWEQFYNWADHHRVWISTNF